MLRFFDFQVNLSTDQGRIKEIEVTARMTGNQEVIVERQFRSKHLLTEDFADDCGNLFSSPCPFQALS